MIPEHDIQEAQKAVNTINLLEAEINRANYLEQEIEALKQKSLNRLMEVDSLKSENAKLGLELSELKAALLGWQDSIEN